MRWLTVLPLLALPIFVFSFTASATTFFSIDDRAETVNEQVKGNNSYQAHLARNFADFASEEVSQHDLRTARAFIQMAEDAAAQAGAAK